MNFVTQPPSHEELRYTGGSVADVSHIQRSSYDFTFESSKFCGSSCLSETPIVRRGLCAFGRAEAGHEVRRHVLSVLAVSVPFCTLPPPDRQRAQNVQVVHDGPKDQEPRRSPARPPLS